MTAEVKHTPGPWAVNEDGWKIESEKDHGWANDGWIVCNTHGPDAEANAKLIAAAPDLLEALEGLLADIEEYQRINKLGGENNHWQVISRAAIAKAKWRS